MTQSSSNKIQFTNAQEICFTLLRIAIGWHFLREGWVKLSHPAWTCAGYLSGSWGPFSPIFQGMAGLTVGDTPILNWLVGEEAQNAYWMISVGNVLIPWLLTLSGLGLLLGIFTRASAITAMSLLVMFYAATPPLDITPIINGTNFSGFLSNIQHAQWAGKHSPGSEGNYLLVNKNLIEFLALAALLSMKAGQTWALDSLFTKETGEVLDEIQTVDIPTECSTS